MRNYKRKANCPQELSKLIEVVNQLPDNADEIAKEISDSLKTKAHLDIDGGYDSKFYKDSFKSLVTEEAVLSYMFEDMSDEILPVLANNRFMDLRQAKRILQGVAQINRNEMERFGKEAFTDKSSPLLNKTFLFVRQMSGIHFTGTLNLDGNGNIKPDVSGLIEILSNYDIPLIRIRACAVCNLIFWAKRIEAETCSQSKCSNALRQRRWQKKKSEANKQRSANRDRNKQLKEIKEKNGTL